ncbi:uncharacterized protein LOC144642579 isoform X1 [Oculina patagonica]
MTSSNDPTITTLSEIVGVKKDELYKKFNLEPWFCDPHHKENLVFLSPTVLLDDRELREGGYKDRGPKEVLARLTNDILSDKKSNQWSSFQVPEIPYLHMGYGKTSETKKHNMALTENEAKVWMNFLDLSNRKQPGEVLREGEIPMEEDVTFPKPERPEDYHAFEFEKGDAEELVDPCNSGLQRRMKGSYLLFFSILLIFYKKKDPAANSNSKQESIGPNKISDFLLFWIIPYLLNFTEQKVNEINEHHKNKTGEEGDSFQVPTVPKSAMAIIQEAMQSCNVPLELEKNLLDKYRKYYGTEKLNEKYTLPETRAHTPIILVPLNYKVRDMPVEIEDIGTKWQEIGDVRLFDEFVSKFVEIEEVQTDFFNSFGYLTDRFATNYGIILPDEATFTEVIEKVEKKHPDLLRELPKQGRSLAPRLGLLKDAENQSVCFSYFSKEHSNKDLFRLTSSYRLSHFNLVVLHGACINPNDPQCKLLNLYPVKAYRRSLYEKQVRRLGGKSEGRFSRLEFPETFKKWEREVGSDNVVKKVTKARGDPELNYSPKYVREQPLEVVYTTAKDVSKLKKDVFGAAVAKGLEDLEKCHIRAANLSGCLLPDIAKRGRLTNVSVVLAINDILQPYGACLPLLEEAMRRVITHFVQGVVVAGLPSVYPPEPDDGGDDESEEEMDETSDDEQPVTSGLTSSGESGIVASNSSSEAAPGGTVKVGTPSNDELEELGNEIAESWKKLARRLKVEEAKITAIHKENEELSEKAYKILLHWRQTNAPVAPATYQVLYDALNHPLVGRSDLAEKYCCEKQ